MPLKKKANEQELKFLYLSNIIPTLTLHTPKCTAKTTGDKRAEQAKHVVVQASLEKLNKFKNLFTRLADRKQVLSKPNTNLFRVV